MESQKNFSPAHEQTDKSAITVSVLHDEIKHCRSDITNYNLQFMASTFLCGLVAVAASILTNVNEEFGLSGISNIFYVLPTLYFYALYNLIKYTEEQVKLGTYRRILEDLLNAYLDTPFLQWETRIPKGRYYIVFGAVVQVLFFLPLAGVLLFGFYMLPRGFAWNIFAVVHLFQVAVVLCMAFHLIHARQETLKIFGYCEDKSGALEPTHK